MNVKVETIQKTLLVANLRREPVSLDPLQKVDPLQETQLLPGECVRVLKGDGDWVRVAAIDQLHFVGGEWKGYEGWLKRDELEALGSSDGNSIVLVGHGAFVGDQPLSMGSRLGEGVGVTNGSYRLIGSAILDPRAFLIESASSFLGTPYTWGGRSSFSTSTYSGVDCSGLVSLCFYIQDRIIPRNAHDQWLACKKVTGALEAGDLVFTAKGSKPDRITHVMLYAGNGDLIEAASEPNVVRRIGVEEKLGKPIGSITSGDAVGERIVHLGTFLW